MHAGVQELQEVQERCAGEVCRRFRRCSPGVQVCRIGRISRIGRIGRIAGRIGGRIGRIGRTCRRGV